MRTLLGRHRMLPATADKTTSNKVMGHMMRAAINSPIQVIY